MSHLRVVSRSLRSAPLYSTAIVGILGLGMALTATVFAIVDGVLLKPLPYRNAGDLYFVAGMGPSGAVTNLPASPRDLEEWRAAVPTAMFASMGTPTGLGNLSIVNGPTIWSLPVDRAFLDILGIHPIAGGFTDDDFRITRPVQVAVISHRIWQRAFGGDPGVIGRDVSLGATRVHVAGILGADFVYPTTRGRTYPDVLVPLVLTPEPAASRSARFLTVIARAERGQSPAVIGDRLSAVSKAAADAPRLLAGLTLTPLQTAIGGQERPMFRVAVAALMALLVLISTNIAGLVASRGSDRMRETVIRRALGASSMALFKEWSAEVSALVLLGMGVGIAAAGPLLAYTSRLLPDTLLLLREPVLDLRVVAIVAFIGATIAAVVSGLSFWRSSRLAVGAVIGHGAGRQSRRSGTWGQRFLIAAQIAIGLVVLLAASLLTTSMRRVWREDPGFRVADVVHLEVRPSGGPADLVPSTRRFLEALRSVPGVDSASAIDAPFLARAQRGSAFEKPGAEAGTDLTEMAGVASGFFRVMEVEAVAGRVLSDEEIEQQAPLVVVSERVARSYWPATSAIGQTLSSRFGTVTVIGVVKDPRLMALDREPTGVIYMPHGLGNTAAAPTLLVRPRPQAGASISALLDVVKRVDAAADVRRARSIEDALGETVRLRRFQAWLFSILGLAALVLTGAGILGLIAMATSRRTREMGIRLALGATPAGVVRRMIGEQMLPVAIGLSAGALSGAWSVRLLTVLLYGVTPYNLGAWLTAVATIVAAVLVSTAVPALRAARVDPVRALQAE